MNTEWLDPTRQDDDLTDVVLRMRHEAAYVFAKRFVDDARVVDVACGVAYGAGVLGDRPATYVGVDRAKEALEVAHSSSPERAYFVCADVAGKMPLRTACGDVVLAFQILEHIPVKSTEAFLDELRRICGPDGRVVITTPNRRHRLLPLQEPWNPYHVREFSRRQLAELLKGHFAEVDVLGLRATEEIERVERERVRQSPFRVYLRPLFSLIPVAIQRWVGTRLRSLAPSGATGEVDEARLKERLSVSDFRVEDDRAEMGLDLVAVCRP